LQLAICQGILYRAGTAQVTSQVTVLTSLQIMKPNFLVILDQAINEGVLRGYKKASEDNENPSKEHICETIEECVLGSLYEHFELELVQKLWKFDSLPHKSNSLVSAGLS